MRKALAGISVIDLSVNAPGPFASLMLADLGAQVVSVINPAGAPEYAGAAEDPVLSGRGGPHDALSRSKSEWPLDLKSETGRTDLLDRLHSTDVVISEMRPGKLEALGLGWDILSARNPRLILCEITGYGYAGPRAGRAGHDINYLAEAGALSLMRDSRGVPMPPLNLVGDYAAGGSLAVSGILAALIRRGDTGRGTRLTVSMTDGVRYLMSDIAAATVLAGHPEESWRGTLGGDMPTYACYRTSDGRWMAVGALEPKFIVALADTLDWPELVGLMSRKSTWDAARSGLALRFESRTQSEWTETFLGVDACVTPVLSLEEAGAEGWPDLGGVLGNSL